MNGYIDKATPLDLIHRYYENSVQTSFSAVFLAIGGLAVPIESIKIIALTVLTGVAYGVTRDWISARECIEYFTMDRRFYGRCLRMRIVKCLHVPLNAVLLGVMSTWHIGAVTGCIFAIAAQVPLIGVVGNLTAVQLGPGFILASAVTLLMGHVESRWAARRMQLRPYEKYPGVPINFQAKWESCRIRCETGNQVLGSLVILGLAAIIAVRARTCRP